MGRIKRAELLPIARDLYARGWPDVKIAEQLHVSRGSVARWRQYDEAQGNPSWESLRREQLAESPFAPLEILKTHFNTVVEQGPAEDEPVGAFADRVAKLWKVIWQMGQQLRDTDGILQALEWFAPWCAANLSDSDLKIVRRAVERFSVDMRAGKVGVPE